MIDEKKLEAKYKYLLMTEAGKNFNVIDFSMDFAYNTTGGDLINEYEVNLKFDYNGAIDADLENFFSDVRKPLSELYNIVSKILITRDGKIRVGSEIVDDYIVHGPMLWDMDYQYDTKHIMNVSFKIDYAL